MNTCHLFNLPFDCKEEDLYRIAYDFGNIKDLNMPLKRGTN